MGREWGALGRVEHQGAFVVEADFLWDPVGGNDVFRENREWIGGVGWDPLTDGGPWRVDRLESIVNGNKIIPATVDNLPEGRRPRAPRMVNGGRGGHALICSKILILQIEW